MRVDATLPANVQQIANVACAAAAGLAPSCGQTSTPPPAAAPAVSAELQDALAHDILGNGLAIAGDDVAYTLIVTNTGGAAAQGVVVATPLDRYLTLDAGSVSTTAGTITAGNAAGDGVPTVQVPSLAAGASFTIRFTASVGALPAGLRFLSSQATIAGANFSPTVSDDPDTPEPLDPTTTPVGAAQVQAIPTLDTWGLGSLVLLLGAACVLRLRGKRPRLATSPAAAGSSVTATGAAETPRSAGR